MQVATGSATPSRLGRKILSSSVVSALLTPNPIDRYLELVNPAWTIDEIRAEVVDVQRQTPRTVTLTVKPNDNWKGFEPGQHCGLTLELDGVRHTRFYSPASSTKRKDGLVEFTVTVKPDGILSNHLRDHAHSGMIVGLSEAEGDFVLPERRPARLLLIGGGSGITPLMSMLRTLTDEDHKGKIDFIHYARSSEDLLYELELRQIAAQNPNVNITRVITRGKQPAPSGHLTRRQLQSIVPDFAKATAYVCGPPTLIDAVEAVWKKDGLQKRLHTECFAPPVLEIPAGEVTGTINFEVSNVEVENDGRTLLEQAEDAGLSPNHGCRMGICHTCDCKIEEGMVRDLRTGEIKSMQDEYIQLCVNAPVGDVQIKI